MDPLWTPMMDPNGPPHFYKNSCYIFSYFISMSQFPPFSNGEFLGNSRPYMERFKVKLNEDDLHKFIKNNFEQVRCFSFFNFMT